MKRSFWFILWAFLISFSASANDSTARVGVGGLELLKTDDIQMVSELLEISTSRIRVTYHFLNTSSQDIKTTVAFPMPAFNNARFAGGHEVQPLESFRMFVDGAPVQTKMHGVLRLRGVDVTDKLRRLGLSDAQIFDPNFPCFERQYEGGPIASESECKITHQQDIALLNMGAVGLGDVEIEEAAYWEQTFPAGREIEVIHEYKPFVGFYQDIDRQRARKEACLDNGTIKALNGRLGEFGRVNLGYQDVEYILGTGRNWKGPIKKFRLIIRKERGTRVSLCFPGKPEKSSPAVIEYMQTDFVPQDKLIIYYVQDRNM